MREIGTLIPSTYDSVAGSDFDLPGFAPPLRDELDEPSANESDLDPG